MQTLELLTTEAPAKSNSTAARSSKGFDAGQETRGPAPAIGQAILTALPLVAADLIAVIGSFAIAWIAITTLWPQTTLDPATLALGFTAAICVANLAMGLYPGIGLSSITEVRQACTAAAYLGAVFLGVSLFQGRTPSTPAIQTLIVVTCCLLLVSLPLARAIARAVFSRYDWWGQPALIVGGCGQATKIYSFLSNNPQLGLRPVGVVGDWHAADNRPAPPYLLGPMAHAAALVAEFNDSWLIVAMPGRSSDEIQSLIGHVGRDHSHRTLISELEGSAGLWRRASRCLDWPGQIRRTQPAMLVRAVKRTIDVVLTVAGGLVLLPALLGIAALIKLGSPGPVLFRQQRVGLNGRRFMVWKFRTMICDGQRVLDEFLAACPKRREAWDRDHKLADDPRVTAIGRLLRKTSLDEMPQLWNVLCGHMSLVGPRPILASEIADFGPSFDDFCSVLPGMTGLWQVSGRNQTTYAEHIELDAFYARNWSLWLDLYILVLTVRVVLFRHGAY